jgi:NADH dehydrogenase [ubiquinone] 1 alpha subcomplex assembly factor 5
MSLRPFIQRFPYRGRPPYAAAATISRSYAVQAPGKPNLEIFNRKVKHLQKDRAARDVEQSRKVDYLKDEVATRLCERLLVRRTFLVFLFSY